MDSRETKRTVPIPSVGADGIGTAQFTKTYHEYSRGTG